MEDDLEPMGGIPAAHPYHRLIAAGIPTEGSPTTGDPPRSTAVNAQTPCHSQNHFIQLTINDLHTIRQPIEILAQLGCRNS